MKNLEWVDGAIRIERPAKPKKITGTRFGAILGQNRWSTPFEAWCAITRTYEKPFTDTIYTKAGKTIEPKQAEWYRQLYYAGSSLTSPTDIYGPDYFKQTFGDFFPDDPIFGGMWDYILFNKDTSVNAVLEMKTTKRAEDWGNDIPEYYALQAALYAYLLHTDNVIMVCSILEENDYSDPDKFVCDTSNTFVRKFKVSERYPNFKRDYIDVATAWWNEYVAPNEKTVTSPAFDPKRDAEILSELKTIRIDPGEVSVEDMIEEAEQLKQTLDENAMVIAECEKRYKVLCDVIKQKALNAMSETDDKAEFKGGKYVFTVSRTNGKELDTDRMKQDGIYDQYFTKPKTTYRLTVKEKK